MKPATLKILQSLRRTAFEDKSKELGQVHEQLSRAEAVVGSARAKLAREIDLASGVAATDDTVEAFARWLPQGRAHLAAAERQRDRIAVELTLRQTECNLARAHLRAIENLMAERSDAATRDELARMQKELDEMAGRGGGARD